MRVHWYAVVLQWCDTVRVVFDYDSIAGWWTLEDSHSIGIIGPIISPPKPLTSRRWYLLWISALTTKLCRKARTSIDCKRHLTPLEQSSMQGLCFLVFSWFNSWEFVRAYMLLVVSLFTCFMIYEQLCRRIGRDPLLQQRRSFLHTHPKSQLAQQREKMVHRLQRWMQRTRSL